jgi:hypothetical protein
MCRRKTILMVAGAILISARYANAADFALAIGSPVAAGTATKVKGGTFAVRMEQCEDPAKAQIAATAEGVVNGARKSEPVTLVPTPSPSVFVVAQGWAEGTWVVNVQATCAGQKAGVIVPIGPAGFLRDSSKMFSRFATNAEVEASLKNLIGGKK